MSIADVNRLAVFYRREAPKQESVAWWQKLVGKKDIGAEYTEKADILENIIRTLGRMKPKERNNALATLAPILAAMDAETKGGAHISPQEILSYYEKIAGEETI